MDSIAVKLSIAIKNSGLSYYELEKRSGISKSALQRYASGKTKKIPMEVIKKLSTILNVSVSYLMDQEITTDITNSSMLSVPIYRSLRFHNNQLLETEIIDYMSMPKQLLKKGKEYFAYYVKESSMIEENINIGDLVIFEKTDTLTNGNIGCFYMDTKKSICRIYRKDKTTNIIMLLPANHQYEPITMPMENSTFTSIGKLAFVLNNRQHNK